MNGSLKKIKEFVENFSQIQSKETINFDQIDTMIALPQVYIYYAQQCIASNLQNYITICAQDFSHHITGSHTGEISVEMLSDINCRASIIGHSERRINESNEMIRKKFIYAAQNNIQPILCIGEINEQCFEEEITAQILESMPLITHNLDNELESFIYDRMDKIIVAYEPVWSIGTGNIPSIHTIQERLSRIRIIIEKIVLNNDINHTQKVNLLYGGSVNEKNIQEIIKIPNLDGTLVGNASLLFSSFFEILKVSSSL